MNKRGYRTVSGFLEYIIAMIFMIIAIFITLMLVNMVSNTELDTQALEAELFYNKMIYTAEGMSYVDENSRTYPHIIDMARFNTATIENAMKYPSEKYASAKLTLKDMDDNIERVVYYNKRWYDNWAPMAGAFIKGPGSATEYEKLIPVLYKQEDEIKQGVMEVSIILPNSR